MSHVTSHPLGGVVVTPQLKLKKSLFL